MKRSVLVLVLFAIGCDVSGEPMQNSPETNRILDHFAGGLRFGDTFEAAGQLGTIVDSHSDESGSTMRLALPDAKHGLSSIRLLGTATPSGNPDSSRIFGVIVFSRADSAEIALTGAISDINRILGSAGERGCIGYSDQHAGVVTVWDHKTGGGTALIEPAPEPASPDEALTRLVVYPQGRKAVDVLPDFRTARCPDLQREHSVP